MWYAKCDANTLDDNRWHTHWFMSFLLPGTRPVSTRQVQWLSSSSYRQERDSSGHLLGGGICQDLGSIESVDAAHSKSTSPVHCPPRLHFSSCVCTFCVAFQSVERCFEHLGATVLRRPCESATLWRGCCAVLERFHYSVVVQWYHKSGMLMQEPPNIIYWAHLHACFIWKSITTWFPPVYEQWFFKVDRKWELQMCESNIKCINPKVVTSTHSSAAFVVISLMTVFESDTSRQSHTCSFC